MSMWWIGVKGTILTVFEATKVEAFSVAFEDQFGVAFGSYRSKEQAEAGVVEHRSLLIEKAKEILSERAKLPEISEKTPEKPLKTSKPAELSGDAVWDDEFRLFFMELQGLKVQIVRVLEAGALLKSKLQENNESFDKKD